MSRRATIDGAAAHDDACEDLTKGSEPMSNAIPVAARSKATDAEPVEADATHYVLRLYVTGSTPNSMRAISNIRKLCESHLAERYELEVVDLSRNPALAGSEQIIAAPTLIKKLPLPLRRFIGDMSQTDRILIGLDLRDAPEGAAPATHG